jgi:hypothetical protein
MQYWRNPMAEETTSRVFLIGFLSALLGGGITLSTDLLKSHFQHEAEKNNVTRALLVEIHELDGAVAVQRSWWRKSVDPKQELQPLIPYKTEVYDHFAGRIDLLDPDLAQRVVDFYAHIRFTNDFQTLANFYNSTEPKRIEFYCRYDRIQNLRFEEKFRSQSQFVFAEYYRRYDLSLSDPETALRTAENPTCKNIGSVVPSLHE